MATLQKKPYSFLIFFDREVFERSQQVYISHTPLFKSTVALSNRGKSIVSVRIVLTAFFLT